MKSIEHRLVIETPIEKVYKSLTTQEGLAGWWTTQTKVKPGVRGSLTFTFEPHYTKEMRTEQLQPNSKVQWRCISAYEEWEDTTITCELQPHARGTALSFQHAGWRPNAETYAGCNFD